MFCFSLSFINIFSYFLTFLKERLKVEEYCRKDFHLSSPVYSSNSFIEDQSVNCFYTGPAQYGTIALWKHYGG